MVLYLLPILSILCAAALLSPTQSHGAAGKPPASLSATLQLPRRGRRSDEEREQIETVQLGVKRIDAIPRHLLKFARPPTRERVRADLDDLIEQAVCLIRCSSRARHPTIQSGRNRSLPPVQLIRQHFQQVLVNVVLNALDAVAGGRGKAARGERSVHSGWLRVRIRDEGAGETPQQGRKAFEPFFTTKPPGRGTGPGLAVSCRLVEQQGGRLRIDGTPGKGTTVRISFRVAPAAAGLSASPRAGPPERGGSFRHG